MKRLFFISIIFLIGLVSSQRAMAQAEELAQLALNIEKLLQFKKILSDMKEGYEILTQGYNAVKDISEGNFNLHKAFLDGLLEVSPTVQKYNRIAQIVEMQIRLRKEYTTAYKRFTASNFFSADELDYLQRVYAQLFDQSLKNISDLTTILTAGKLRMSDDERLSAIDHIYDDQRDQLDFLCLFNNKNSLLLVQRAKEKNNTQSYYHWYDK
jgi:hypothetical protein